MSLAELDAVTLDAFGTLLALTDPVPALRAALKERGVERDDATVRAAFAAEAVYYEAHKIEARTEVQLANLYARCGETFLSAVDAAHLDGFDYAGFFTFEVIDGVEEALERLRASGLALAVVADWDVSVHRRLRESGLDRYLDTVVATAEVGASKPDPAGFHLALGRLGVVPRRALHVGDQPRDAEGAEAAGMHFEPTPLRQAVERLV